METTAVVALAVLFPESGSALAEVTVATFVISPGANGATAVIVIVDGAPGSNVDRAHVAMPAAIAQFPQSRRR